jgi:hypothetical protein
MCPDNIGPAKEMSTHYYSIKDANRIGEQPVEMIMKTTGYTYFGPGIYHWIGAPHVYVRLTHISRWDFYMLDAFGVEVVTSTWFRNMDKLHA